MFDNITSSVVLKTDAIIEIEKIRAFARDLRDSTSRLRDYKNLDKKIPLIKTSVNKAIAGEGRTIADLFDLTDWADNLKGSVPIGGGVDPSLFPTSTYIRLSELLKEMRAALSNATKPDLAEGELPPVPDMKVFGVSVGSNCANNDKAFFIDVVDSSGILTVTLCSYLEFEVDLEFDAKVRMVQSNGT